MNNVAGIGARVTPQLILHQMENLGTKFASAGWTLRSGGALGADSAFERGFVQVSGKMEIFLPWARYNGNLSNLIGPPQEAYDLIDSLFADAKYRSPGVRALWARNCQQIIGEKLDDPSDLVMCWTKDGKDVGGTGRALIVARKFKVPIINLALQKDVMDFHMCYSSNL